MLPAFKARLVAPFEAHTRLLHSSLVARATGAISMSFLPPFVKTPRLFPRHLSSVTRRAPPAPKTPLRLARKISLPLADRRVQVTLPLLTSFAMAATSVDTFSVPSCFTTFPVCVHEAERDIARCEDTVPKIVRELAPHLNVRLHSIGPYGNVFAFCYPTGLTERVGLNAEIVEALWIYDGASFTSLSSRLAPPTSLISRSRRHRSPTAQGGRQAS